MYNAVFFVLFIIFGAFCVLNLFVSIVVARFQQIRDTTEGAATFLLGSKNGLLRSTLCCVHLKRVYLSLAHCVGFVCHSIDLCKVKLSIW